MIEASVPSLRTRSLRITVRAMRIGLCLAVCPAVTQSSTTSSSMPATPWTGATGIRRTTQEIMQSQAMHDGESGVMRTIDAPRLVVDRSCLPLNPAAPNVSQLNAKPASEPSSSQAGLSLSGQTFGLNFTAIVYTETFNNPPSPSGAAGPTEFLLGVNQHLRSFDKATAAIGHLNVPLQTFFDPVRNGGSVGSPRVRYDRHSQRWFILAANYYPGSGGSFLGPNHVLLAVSDGPGITASTSWTFFSFQQDQVSPPADSNCMVDAPTLGIDANALYIGANLLCGIGTPGYHGGSVAFVVRKSSVLGNGPIVVSAFRNLCDGSFGPGPFGPQGVDNFDAGAAQGYIIGVDNASFGMLTLRRIDNPAGTPSISGNILLTVPATYPPPTIPHQGNDAGANGNLSAGDDRLAAVHIRGGRLWAAHNIGVNASGTAVPPPTRVGIRWYELGDLHLVPYVVRSGTIYHSASTNPLSYWMPSVMTTGQGRTGFGFNIAGAASYVDAAATSLLAGGSVLAPERFTNTDSAFNPFYDDGGSKGRLWGTHSSTSLDPSDNTTLWTVQEFPASSTMWGVRVAQFFSPGPILDNRVYHACRGHTGWVLNITGANFQDAGPGFTRPTVEIGSDGVTVQSVVVVDSEHVTVTIDIAPDAAMLSHDIVYTNSDGQTATLFEGLMVHGGRADLNGDCHVDAADVLLFIACSTGPGVPYDIQALPEGCDLPVTSSEHLPPDFDDDLDVDARDFALLQRCYTGPNGYIEADLECWWGYP